MNDIVWRPTKVPRDVPEDMLASRQSERTAVPELQLLTRIPVFTADGDLIVEPGFHPGPGIFYWPAPGFEVHVVENPSDEQVRCALADLCEPLQDFPFVDKSDDAHALALMLEPFVRQMWQGPSPMFLIDKPVAGTGATLLAQVVTYIAHGQLPPLKSQPKDDAEWEKTITAMLDEGAPVIFFDNVTGLYSSALTMALTADIYKGRLLGVSKTVEVPVRCTWIVTGNNPDMPDEMWRRCVNIRLIAEVAQPEDRPPTSFHIPRLKEWVAERRPRLVAAALTLVQAWVQAGRRPGELSKASYEGWAATLGGILEHAGVEGFLCTPEDRRRTDSREDEMRALVVRWLRYAVGLGANIGGGFDFSKPVQATALVELAKAESVPIEYAHREPARVMGNKLKVIRDRVYDLTQSNGDTCRVVVRAHSVHNSLRWWLEYDPERAIKVAGVSEMRLEEQELAELDDTF